MRIRFTPILFTLFAFVTTVFASPEEKEFNNNVTEIIQKHFPKAEITTNNGNLVAKHGTMVFSEHARLKTGEIKNEVKKVEGPNYKGFMLSISLQSERYRGAAIFPQTLRRTYWQTFIDRPSRDGGQGHYVIDFSYGSQLNQDFKKAILEAISELSSEQDGAEQPATASESKPEGGKNTK